MTSPVTEPTTDPTPESASATPVGDHADGLDDIVGPLRAISALSRGWLTSRMLDTPAGRRQHAQALRVTGAIQYALSVAVEEQARAHERTIHVVDPDDLGVAPDPDDDLDADGVYLPAGVYCMTGTCGTCHGCRQTTGHIATMLSATAVGAPDVDAGYCCPTYGNWTVAGHASHLQERHDPACPIGKAAHAGIQPPAPAIPPVDEAAALRAELLDPGTTAGHLQALGVRVDHTPGTAR